MAPGVALTFSATPSLPLAGTDLGHFTDDPSPTPAFHSALTIERYAVNPAVVPDESSRTTSAIGIFGSFRPGLIAAISLSAQWSTLPRKILASRGPVSL